jgi:hypothetical protein
MLASGNRLARTQGHASVLLLGVLALSLSRAPLAACNGATKMDVDLSELLRQTGLEVRCMAAASAQRAHPAPIVPDASRGPPLMLQSVESKLLAHGVSNLHTLKILEDGDVDDLGLPPMVAKLFRQKYRHLIADLENKKGTPVALPSEEQEAERKRKKEQLQQDMLYCIGAVIVGGVGMFVYVFYIQKPVKLRQE